MKIKAIILAALAFTVSQLTGCNDSEPGVDGNSKSVKIRIVDPLTRAEGNPVGTNAVTFGDGHIFFVSQTGLITKHMTITSAITSDTNIELDELKTGVVIKNVADNSKEVYIIANLPAGVTVPSSPLNLNISAIKELTVDVKELKDASGGVTAIPLYGKGIINTNTDPAEVEVTIEAIASRIEIVKFDLKPTADLVKYQIDGIFINYYYEEMQLDGTVDNDDFTDNGTENDGNTKYIGGGNTGLYPDALPLWDYNTAGIGNFNSGVYTPKGAGKVWAYNVFPGAPAPHIIVRLTDMEYSDGTPLPEPLFLTVRTYNNKAITAFEKGKAYQIENFLFDENDLTDKPEVGVMDIDVSVNIVPWKTVTVTPDL